MSYTATFENKHPALTLNCASKTITFDLLNDVYDNLTPPNKNSYNHVAFHQHYAMVRIALARHTIFHIVCIQPAPKWQQKYTWYDFPIAGRAAAAAAIDDAIGEGSSAGLSGNVQTGPQTIPGNRVPTVKRSTQRLYVKDRSVGHDVNHETQLFEEFA